MKAQVYNARFYYAVQVYINEQWETIETFSCQSFAKELRDKLLKEKEMSAKDLYKKYCAN